MLTHKRKSHESNFKSTTLANPSCNENETMDREIQQNLGTPTRKFMLTKQDRCNSRQSQKIFIGQRTLPSAARIRLNTSASPEFIMTSKLHPYDNTSARFGKQEVSPEPDPQQLTTLKSDLSRNADINQLSFKHSSVPKIQIVHTHIGDFKGVHSG